jgi:hypothetical protein
MSFPTLDEDVTPEEVCKTLADAQPKACVQVE